MHSEAKSALLLLRDTSYICLQGKDAKARPKPWEEAEVQLFTNQLRQHGPDWAAIQVSVAH